MTYHVHVQGLFPLTKAGSGVIVTTAQVAAPTSQCSWQDSGLKPAVTLPLLPPAALPLSFGWSLGQPLGQPSLRHILKHAVAGTSPSRTQVQSACASDSATSPPPAASSAFADLFARKIGPAPVFHCASYWVCIYVHV